MKRIMCLLQEVLLDRGTWCGVSTTADFKRISSRVEHEGQSFSRLPCRTMEKASKKALTKGSSTVVCSLSPQGARNILGSLYY